MSSPARIHSICTSQERGDRKQPVAEAQLIAGSGLLGDAHAGSERQVSLLPFEAFDAVRASLPDIRPGDFAENITTLGLDFAASRPGKILAIGTTTRLIVTHIGKECHQGCHIRDVTGDCIMPRLGIFARVTEGGRIKVGDTIRWIDDEV